jgi:hypothetical protein
MTLALQLFKNTGCDNLRTNVLEVCKIYGLVLFFLGKYHVSMRKFAILLAITSKPAKVFKTVMNLPVHVNSTHQTDFGMKKAKGYL